MGLWFPISGELFYRGEDIPTDWNFSPGTSDGRDPDDAHWGLEDVPTADLLVMGERLHELYEECEENGDWY